MLKGVRLPLPAKAPKVETPRKGKGSYRRKPKTQRQTANVPHTQKCHTKIFPLDP